MIQAAASPFSSSLAFSTGVLSAPGADAANPGGFAALLTATAAPAQSAVSPDPVSLALSADAQMAASGNPAGNATGNGLPLGLPDLEAALATGDPLSAVTVPDAPKGELSTAASLVQSALQTAKPQKAAARKTDGEAAPVTKPVKLDAVTDETGLPDPEAAATTDALEITTEFLIALSQGTTDIAIPPAVQAAIAVAVAPIPAAPEGSALTASDTAPAGSSSAPGRRQETAAAPAAASAPPQVKTNAPDVALQAQTAAAPVPTITLPGARPVPDRAQALQPRKVEAAPVPAAAAPAITVQVAKLTGRNDATAPAQHVSPGPQEITRQLQQDTVPQDQLTHHNDGSAAKSAAAAPAATIAGEAVAATALGETARGERSALTDPASVTPLAATQPQAVPVNADTQASIQSAEIAVSAAAPTADTRQTGHDFATLVDRLVEARQAAMPLSVHASVSHRDFGQVSLRFDQDAAGLSVAMSSADPDFARAVQASASAAGSQTANDSSARQDAPRQDSAGQQQQQATGSAFGQSQSQNQSQASARDDRGAQPQTAQRASSSQSRDDQTTDADGEIFA